MRKKAAEPEQEVKRLQSCISDLVSVLALPAAWNNSGPNRILETFLDALVKLLDLTFIYAQARVGSHEAPIEVLRTAESDGVSDKRDEIRQALQRWLDDNRTNSLPAIRRLIGGREISTFPLQLGIEGSVGLILVGCQRLDFPQQTERLVMSVAANQLAVMLQQAHFLSEQRRVALELNERVAQRTAELAAANQELRKEIAERKEIEEQLRESEALIAEAQHLARVGSFSWLVATDEIKWSEQLYRIFEFELGVPITFNLIRSRVHPEDLHLTHDMIERMERAASDYEYVCRLLMPDHSIKHLHLIAHASRGRQGQLEYIGAIQDVTQRRLSEEALTKARSELAQGAKITSIGVLTAAIAHEVNQPLSGIITNASTCLRMLSADPPNVGGALETARRTIRDGNRASDVITRLRTLFSKKEVNVEPVDINEVAREVITLSLSELQTNRVILRQDFADGLSLVEGDRIQLQQVILNLLRNASDAMSSVENRPKQLLLKTELDNERIRLSVQDSGVGFDPKVADRLFESFFTTKQDGMGIGLSVSRSIIEAHGGRMWATANDGPGATFAFSIPCEHIPPTR